MPRTVAAGWDGAANRRPPSLSLAAEVKLGGEQIERAAAARAARPPAALLLITATEYAYRRPDGIIVAPLALLGP